MEGDHEGVVRDGRHGLVLSRRPNESVLIDGGRIKLTVVEVKGNRVRLLFEADRSIEILRSELVEEIDGQP